MLQISSAGATHAYSFSSNDVTPTPTIRPCPTPTSQSCYNLIYHNGLILSGTVTAYPIFWFPSSFTNEPTYISLIEQYYTDVQTSCVSGRFYHILVQYTDSQGDTPSCETLWSGQYYLDTNPYPNAHPTTSDLLSEIKADGVTEGWADGENSYFVIYTDPTHNVNGDCAAHGNDPNQPDPTQQVYYGYISYGCGNLPDSPNKYIAADNAISSSAHEQFEAETDPFFGQGWYVRPVGCNTCTYEVADLCAAYQQYGPLNYDGGLANQKWNNHFYLIQEMWSNSQTSCSQGA